MKPRLPPLAVYLLGGWAAVRSPAQEPAPRPPEEPPAATSLDRTHRSLYEKVRPSIVGVRAQGTLGEVSGTGILIDADGTILTASSVVGRGSENIRVWLAGPRVTTARIIGVRPEDECALIRIEGHGLKPIELGDSDAVAVGRRAYTIGNPENTLINDDQAAWSVGIVSGLYGIRDERMGSTYTGRALETTAAVNPGMEGGALVDGEGRLIGLVILNYSPLRWLGVAIPVNTLKPVIAQIRRDETAAAPAARDEGGEAYLGIEFDAPGSDVPGLGIRSVAPDSPAEAAGLAVGDRILEFAGKKVESPDAFAARLHEHAPGSLVWIQISLAGERREIKVKLGMKP